ncbi:hypothetical protein EBO15_19025 [Actinomadura harenae]|uniref:Uncharacterized protein n=1 Tax=Actinomadura harenae TaxID=2483351 RepID=A0A3M2LZB6_9ACTN|nr:hypothetical protein EBO15_19025 [Actinomadura harenae]
MDAGGAAERVRGEGRAVDDQPALGLLDPVPEVTETADARQRVAHGDEGRGGAAQRLPGVGTQRSSEERAERRPVTDLGENMLVRQVPVDADGEAGDAQRQHVGRHPGRFVGDVGQLPAGRPACGGEDPGEFAQGDGGGPESVGRGGPMGDPVGRAERRRIG